MLLKSLLKQYLDGISLNDDVLKNNNPLFVVTSKDKPQGINLTKSPVEKIENKTVIDGPIQIKNVKMQL